MTREEKILEHENLVWMMIHKMGLIKYKDEFYSVGIIGLINAIDTFDESKGTKFSTYACRCISNAIVMEKRKFYQNKSKANYNTRSLDEIVYSNNDKPGIHLEELLQSDIDLETEMINKENIKALNKAMKKLDENELKIIKTLYGINDDKDSQVNIAMQLNISQAQISRRKAKILKKIKRMIDYNE